LKVTANAVDGLVDGIREAGAMEQLSTAQKNALRKQSVEGLRNLNLRWLDEMVQGNPLREKMAFFWHGHFACRNLNIYFQQQLLDIIRRHAMGNFGELLREVSRSAAMLAFLNNQQNRKQSPNENFAREVMELFTLGRGHYTEADIREAARAFTGWGFNLQGEFVFRASLHDAGSKTVLGRSGSTGLSLAVRAILVALALLAWPGYLLGRALTLPLVNDLTTDLEEPPSFSRSRAALMARGGYQPPEFVPSDTESGLAVYRDLQGMTLESSAGEAYLAALKAVASLGWRIVDQVPPGGRTGTGRIDAVATTTLFRFADDITIRVRPVAGETRVDIRSRSRVGRHDLGVNAGRIRAFLAELREQAAAR
jgi:hypothetical protein